MKTKLKWIKPKITSVKSKKSWRCRWFGHVYVSTVPDEWVCKHCPHELTTDERLQNWGM